MNDKEISHRVALLMEQNELSVTAFAERIGASRSSISHILSGRNKPSLEIAMSIVENFAEVSYDYLLHGGKKNHVAEEERQITPSSTREISTGKADKAVMSLKDNAQSSQEKQQTESAINGKNLLKVILLYDDGSFENFIP